MADPAPRPRQQRLDDTRHRLATDIDAWVATSSVDSGSPYLIPLSFLWDGETALIATGASSVTGRNLQANGRVRLGLGPTRDLVLIEGTAETVTPEHLSPAEGDAFAVKSGFDPRTLSSPYLYFRIRPHLVQAWREENELKDRVLMRDGRWLEP